MVGWLQAPSFMRWRQPRVTRLADEARSAVNLVPAAEQPIVFHRGLLAAVLLSCAATASAQGDGFRMEVLGGMGVMVVDEPLYSFDMGATACRHAQRRPNAVHRLRNHATTLSTRPLGLPANARSLPPGPASPPASSLWYVLISSRRVLRSSKISARDHDRAQRTLFLSIM